MAALLGHVAGREEGRVVRVDEDEHAVADFPIELREPERPRHVAFAVVTADDRLLLLDAAHHLAFRNGITL